MKNWTGENERKRLMPQERTGFEVILFIFFIIWEVRRDLGRLITQIAACFGHKSFSLMFLDSWQHVIMRHLI